MKHLFAAACLSSLCLAACRHAAPPDHSSWPAYAGTKSGSRYSSDDQIKTSDVAQLQVAWTYSSQDKDTDKHSQNQCNPIVVDNVLYGTTPRLKLFALDAATGASRWLFAPAAMDSTAKDDPYAFFKVSRGVMYWQSEDGTYKRILYGAGARIYAVNARDGRPVASFGKGGYVDLSEDLDRPAGSYNTFIAAT